jgi:hypothetical protein
MPRGLFALGGCIKDDVLAGEVRRIESMSGVTAAQSRALMRAAIRRLYTWPA